MILRTLDLTSLRGMYVFLGSIFVFLMYFVIFQVTETKVIDISRAYAGRQYGRTSATTTIPTLVFDYGQLPGPEELVRPDSVYPGFRPYFHVACLIFFGVLIIVIYDVSRQLLIERKIQRSTQRYNDYAKVPTIS